MNLEEEHQAVWEQNFPGQRIPGSAEPLEGKCGAKIRNKNLAAIQLQRHCKAASGQGTNHLGVDHCSRHGGSTPTQVRGAMRKTVHNEMALLSEQLGESPAIGPPEIEFARLAAKAKGWMLALEVQLNELQGAWTSYDAQGVERARAVIELWERSIDRLSKFLEFSMRFDLQKKVVALEERQAQLISNAFFGLIMSQDLKLTEAQIGMMRIKFAESMMELGSQLSPSWATGIIDAEIVED